MTQQYIYISYSQHELVDLDAHLLLTNRTIEQV